MQRARVELVTQDTRDFASVVLNAEYVLQGVSYDYQNGGKLKVYFVVINTNTNTTHTNLNGENR